MINIMNMINVNVNIMATATGTGTGGNNNNNNNNNNNGGSGSGSGSGSGGGNNNNNNNNNGGSGGGSGSGAGNNNNNNNNNGRGFTYYKDGIPTFLVNSRRRRYRREISGNILLYSENRTTPDTFTAMESLVRRTMIDEDSGIIDSQPSLAFSKYLINIVEESFTDFQGKCARGVPFCELLQITEF